VNASDRFVELRINLTAAKFRLFDRSKWPRVWASAKLTFTNGRLRRQKQTFAGYSFSRARFRRRLQCVLRVSI